ncbi:peptidylprolyl isomerase [Motilibacter aurantiacus]|uniref:peptidylprolyl isomerase n=1 Tax=Motilibacter aurantiacus TaxID=2714955 RepID=UPI00140D9053|nr:peptidylprolyl isomerase [Motilibacter aurantiacus]NHC46054.1 peptidylprolyl isomerase [Motilibacter aurantiacus]
MAASNKRERQLARERYVRQQARRAEARKRRRQRTQVLAAVAAVVAVIAGVAVISLLVNNDDDTLDAPAAAPESTASVESTPAAPVVDGCTASSATGRLNAPQFDEEPALTVDKASYTATLDTNCGPIELTLDGAKAPHTVNSFAFLAEEKFFDGTPCHRLTTSGLYVLQCGDPTGTGTGGPGYQFEDENLPEEGAANYPAGTVAMANSGAGTNGSQFFLVYEDTQLPPNYSIFGKITKGLDILKKVAAAGVADGGGDGAPSQPVTLDTVTVAKARG